MVWWIECAAHSKDSAVAARECSLVKVDLVDGALDVVHRRGCRMDAALDLELSDWYAKVTVDFRAMLRFNSAELALNSGFQQKDFKMN